MFGFFFAVLFKLLPKISDFINSDDCIGKITSNSIRLKPVLFKKRFEVNKKQIIFCKKKEKFR